MAISALAGPPRRTEPDTSPDVEAAPRVARCRLAFWERVAAMSRDSAAACRAIASGDGGSYPGAATAYQARSVAPTDCHLLPLVLSFLECARDRRGASRRFRCPGHSVAAARLRWVAGARWSNGEPRCP